MGNSSFNIVIYTNAVGLGTETIAWAHRLPFIESIASSMKGIGKVLEKFTLGNISSKIVSLYEELLHDN